MGRPVAQLRLSHCRQRHHHHGDMNPCRFLPLAPRLYLTACPQQCRCYVGEACARVSRCFVVIINASVRQLDERSMRFVASVSVQAFMSLWPCSVSTHPAIIASIHRYHVLAPCVHQRLLCRLFRPMSAATPDFELYYWPGLAGRGEFVRLMFAVIDVPFVDHSKLNPDECRDTILGVRSGKRTCSLLLAAKPQ